MTASRFTWMRLFLVQAGPRGAAEGCEDDAVVTGGGSPTKPTIGEAAPPPDVDYRDKDDEHQGRSPSDERVCSRSAIGVDIGRVSILADFGFPRAWEFFSGKCVMFKMISSSSCKLRQQQRHDATVTCTTSVRWHNITALIVNTWPPSRRGTLPRNQTPEVQLA